MRPDGCSYARRFSVLIAVLRLRRGGIAERLCSTGCGRPADALRRATTMNCTFAVTDDSGKAVTLDRARHLPGSDHDAGRLRRRRSDRDLRHDGVQELRAVPAHRARRQHLDDAAGRGRGLRRVQRDVQARLDLHRIRPQPAVGRTARVPDRRVGLSGDPDEPGHGQHDGEGLVTVGPRRLEEQHRFLGPLAPSRGTLDGIRERGAARSR